MPRILLFLALFHSLFLSLPAAARPADPPRRLVLIDDDVIGLNGVPALLLQVPDVEVLGITTTSGSVWRDTATAHALRTLELTGKPNVPVVPGAVYPLLNSREQVIRWEGMYGRLVFKGPWTDYWPGDTIQEHPGVTDPADVPDLSYGNPSIKASDEIAALFLIRMARRYPGQVTLFATGPMTNIALALSLDPEFARNIKELVYMGGSLNPRQHLSNPSADQFAREFVNSPRREFNIRWDPEAARIMAHAPWRRITMIPVDPSTGTQWTRGFLDSLGSAPNPLTGALARSIAVGFPMWDELAAMVWLEPGIVTKRDTLYVDFETSMTAGYGDTLSWTEAYRPKLGEQAQDVVLEVDRERMEAAMRALYTRPIAGGGKR
ncbi:nucleoside hydrolase [Sphingomonas canadensis]|uniref:Nucleoside hydrolase n=1 Tax=Sphingomonas canadensis TaxID=1219257 RepID=A0ABW3H8H9_9SPHN|nr:nucleoside hydrolase [Sphingomonas canadensis]MCW3835592.1 nucleoside hydrolase [Sphingomonas canadensis]